MDGFGHSLEKLGTDVVTSNRFSVLAEAGSGPCDGLLLESPSKEIERGNFTGQAAIQSSIQAAFSLDYPHVAVPARLKIIDFVICGSLQVWQLRLVRCGLWQGKIS